MPKDSSKPPRPAGNTVPTNPGRHANVIADAVDAAWHRGHGHGDFEIPVSVVAALAMLAPTESERDQAATDLLGLDARQLAALVTAQWAAFIRARPDLINPAWPLIEPWRRNDLSDETRAAAKAVADAAVRAGQLHLTGTERRRDTDLFGPLLAVLRTRTAASARGQFYTPAALTDVIALVRGALDEGEQVVEPTAGTGGMLRAAAQTMRAAGRDPGTVQWWAVDIDPLAIACLAVNTVLWELGHQVILGVGDALTDDWQTHALAQRNETVELAERLAAMRLFTQALQTADAFLANAAHPPDNPVN